MRPITVNLPHQVVSSAMVEVWKLYAPPDLLVNYLSGGLLRASSPSHLALAMYDNNHMIWLWVNNRTKALWR